MPLVPITPLLKDAVAGGYAVGAFNTNNLEYISAILDAAEEMKSPVIIQAAESETDYMDGDIFISCVKKKTEHMTVPVCVHLDHGPSFETAMRCIRCGPANPAR